MPNNYQAMMGNVRDYREFGGKYYKAPDAPLKVDSYIIIIIYLSIRNH